MPNPIPKHYTAEEMRKAAGCAFCKNEGTPHRATVLVELCPKCAMLRQAAATEERVKRLEEALKDAEIALEEARDELTRLSDISNAVDFKIILSYGYRADLALQSVRAALADAGSGEVKT